MGGITSGDEPSPLLDKQVLILGAGGVARSIAFGLTRRGAASTVTNRHDERAAELAEEVGCRAVSWANRAGVHNCDILDQLHARRHAPERRRHADAARRDSSRGWS